MSRYRKYYLDRPIPSLYPGKTAWRWTVLSRAPSKGKYLHFWNCRCACGTEKVVADRSIRFGLSRSCGCGNYGEEPKVGELFGDLEVLSRDETRGPARYWWVVCRTCGHRFERSVHTTFLRRWVACDGHEDQRVTTGNYASEMKAHPLFATWGNMLQRCANPRTNSFKNYGGRGIAVCERWRSSFAAFLEDMGPKPTPEHTLDRIDNDGNYEPGNCRWATMKEQASNRRRSGRAPKQHELRGERKTLAEWCAASPLGLAVTTVSRRLDEGWDLERALSEPVSATTAPPRYLEVGGKRVLLADAARAIGLTPRQLRKRLKKGWSVERATSTPPVRR